MQTSFDKAQILQAQHAAEKDPATKARIGKALDRYYNLDQKEEQQKIRTSKPHYGLGRVVTVLTIPMVVLFFSIAAVDHYFPNLPLHEIAWVAIPTYLVVVAFGLRVLGHLSEEGAAGVLSTAAGLLTGGSRTFGKQPKATMLSIPIVEASPETPSMNFEHVVEAVAAAESDELKDGDEN